MILLRNFLKSLTQASLGFTAFTLLVLTIVFQLIYPIETFAQNRHVQISNFDDSGKLVKDSDLVDPPFPWKIIRLNSKIPATRYLVLIWDGVPSVQAIANNSMALFARTLDVDLQRTPVLCWRWRVDAPLLKADMQKKQGDDYAARIYIAFRLPNESLSFSTKMKLKLARGIYGDLVPDAALNYVWDNRYPVGTTLANAYTDRTQMIVVETGITKAGKWIDERRDVLVDAINAFGHHRFTTTQFAVAADTDNTGESVRSGFANIHFVGSDMPCQF